MLRDDSFVIGLHLRLRFFFYDTATFELYTLSLHDALPISALDWIGRLAEVLPDPETAEVVFDFQSWDGQACYFHDPAGNIVELTAHRAIGATDATGPFAGSELLGFSELGLVGNTPAMARVLGMELQLQMWQGTVEE